MKKLMFMFTVFAAALSVSAAPQKNTGPGWGYLIFKNEDGLLSQVCAVTTNGTLCNGTFAITSGTNGAEKPATFVRTEQIDNFVAENMDNLARDIAAGQGESLDTLITLMDVDATHKASVAQTLKTNFATIFSSDTVTHQDVIKAINELVKA